MNNFLFNFYALILLLVASFYVSYMTHREYKVKLSSLSIKLFSESNLAIQVHGKTSYLKFHCIYVDVLNVHDKLVMSCAYFFIQGIP